MTPTSTVHEWDRLIGACSSAARSLPADQVRHLAERAAQVSNPSLIRQIQDRPPTQRFREAAAHVVTAWQHIDPPPRGDVVAGILLGSISTWEQANNLQTVDLVWTGPGSDDIRAQATDEVVVGLINEARHSVILSTFASRRVENVLNALSAAEQRGVAITLILENEESSNGQYKPPRSDPFEDIDAEILEWPRDRRPTRGRWTASLHAKFVVVDEDALFVTSANLTDFAMDLNIEAGVIIRGGPLPARLHKHLRDLTYSGTLQPITG